MAEMDFSKVVVYRLIETRMSRKKLSELTGINYHTLNQYIQNRNDWQQSKINKVAKALGLKITIE